MNTSSLHFIDRIFIKPFLYVLNIFVRITGKILRPNHDLTKDFNVIAVCKFKGMGSIIQATPLLQTLRKRYPKAEIIFVSSTGNKEILEKIPVINTLVLLNDKSFFTVLTSIFPFTFKLIRKKIKVYLDLEIYSHFSSLVTTCSLARNRIGFYLRSGDYRMGIYTHMMYYNTRSAISMAYLQMARLLGITELNTNLYNFQSQNINQIKLSGEQVINLKSDKYFVVNINASDLRIERRWGIDNFVSLINLLQNNYTFYKYIIIGSKKEQEYVQNFMSKLSSNDNIVNCCGETSIDELIALIQHAELMITNDTGPMHIAFSVKTPTVALFGPCLPSQYGIFEHANILYHQVYCSPCVHEFTFPPCKGNNQCMKNINLGEVFKAIEKSLSGEFSMKNYPSPIIWTEQDHSNIPLGIVSRS